MQLGTAVRISISIPLYFGAVFLNEEKKITKPTKTNHYDVYVDGGLLSNYPLTIFDSCAAPLGNECDSLLPNLATLGIKLDRPAQIAYDSLGNNDLAGYDIRSFSSYINSLYNILFETVNKQHNDAAEKKRTVYISTSGISPRIRKMKTAEKEILLQNGYSSTMNFLKTSSLSYH
jgi:NTE family protein